jgi:hypothetical protein
MTHREILGLWPTLADAARAIGRDYEAVKAWHRRDSIPGEAYVSVVRAAAAAGHELTFGRLAKAAHNHALAKEARKRAQTAQAEP